MQPSIAELRAARTLHRWLRRAALAAVPIVGLTSCGDDCTYSPYSAAYTLLADAGPPGAAYGGDQCKAKGRISAVPSPPPSPSYRPQLSTLPTRARRGALHPAAQGEIKA